MATRDTFWDCLGRHNIMTESGSPGKLQAGSPTSLSQKDNEERKMMFSFFQKKEESYIKDTTKFMFTFYSILCLSPFTSTVFNQ